MAEDGAEAVDDLICVMDKVVGSQMDTVLVLLAGWLLFGAVIFLVSHLIYSTLSTTNDTADHGSTIPTLSVSPPSDVPSVTGADPSAVNYTQEILQYLMSGPAIKDDLLTLWKERLSHYAKIHSNEDGILVTFTEINSDSLDITLDNVTVDNISSDKLAIDCDITLGVDMKLKHSSLGKPRRRSGSATSINEWQLVVESLCGRVSATISLNEKSIVAKFEGWPHLQLRLTWCNPEAVNVQMEPLAEVIKKIASEAIRCTQLDLRIDRWKNFPSFKKSVFHSNAHNNLLSNSNKSGGKAFSREITGIGENSCVKVMGVKVVKAAGLKMDNVVAYVVVEVDEPSQRFQTRACAGPACVWDQNFSVNLTKHSSEILFEIWDQSGATEKFLGLGIVSVSELMTTPSQRHVIPLQGRPYEDDQVSGLLTIEFVFKDSSKGWTNGVMPGVHRTFETSEMRDNTINKKTVYTRQESSVPGMVSGMRVAEMALKDIMTNKAMNGSNNQPSKSTLLMHQVRTMISPNSSKIQRGETSSPTDNTDDASDISIASKQSAVRNSSTRLIFSDKVEFVPITDQSSENYHKYSRGRKQRNRNIISSFRRSFKGKRSHSSHGMADGSNTVDSYHLSPRVRVRSASENRADDDDASVESDSDSGCSVSLKSWRGDLSLSWQSDLNGGGGLGGFLGNNDDGSSMSDVSGISNVSNKTYVTEESSLVLEVYERGRLHHYLIPLQAAKQGKFQKRGTKLHIYMDHIFTAQHIKLGSQCQACSRLIPLRLGKQAYVCRDCGVTTHKQCHSRVESHCPRSSLDKMELKHSSKHSPPMQSVSLDNSSGSGRSRLNILRKNIFRRRHRKNNESK